MQKLLLNLTTKISVLLAKILIWRYNLKIITVAGSVGKTSTKYILGNMLGTKFPTVGHQDGYNQPYSIPFALFGLAYPDNAKNVVAWAQSYFKMLSLIITGYHYKIAVLEVGTEMPGEIAQTTSWLKSDIAILTAVQEEHMQNFKNLEDVAKEEFQIFKNANLKFISSDSVSEQFIQKFAPEDARLYGFNKNQAEFKDLSLTLKLKDFEPIKFNALQPAEYLNQPFIVAALALQNLGFNQKDIETALQKIKLPPGRMRIFPGINNSVIVDDTYNASPEAYARGLNLIYSMDAGRRIIVMGNMNEFGKHSPSAHTQLAKLIKPNKDDIIATIGPDANTHLFAELERLGTKNLFKFNSPWEVGRFLKSTIKDGDLVFLKGSQNGVFLEEATRMVLLNPKDSKNLCRQSNHWMNIKAEFKKKIEVK
jgi:UDP-N-acetylmuramoyl-tripeptide--D-alanyl-D-alanine ligase